MKKIYSLIVMYEKNENIESLIRETSPYCIESRSIDSSTGMEIATLVLSGLNLLIALTSVPLLVDAINNKKVIVKAGGFKINDPAEKILQGLKRDQNLMSELTEAYKSGTLEIEGTTERVVAFQKGLKELIDEEICK